MGKNKQLQEKRRGIKRSTLSGRIVNGRDIILCEEAVIYLKKMGYKIISPSIIAGIWTFMIVFLMLGFISIVSAFPEGNTIIESYNPSIEKGNDYNYSFIIHNSSNGAIIINDICNFSLKNTGNNLLFIANPEFIESETAYKMNIIGSNFTNAGKYPYTLTCSNAGLSGTFTITDTGLFSVKDDNIYILILISLIFAVIIGISFFLDYNILASLTTTIFGFYLLFNKVNLIISVIIICLGLYLAFRGKQ